MYQITGRRIHENSDLHGHNLEKQDLTLSVAVIMNQGWNLQAVGLQLTPRRNIPEINVFIHAEALEFLNIVTYRPISRQRHGKHNPVEAYARNSRTSIARQRISNQAFPTIERLCFLRGPCKVVIKKISVEAVQWRVQFRDTSQPGYGLGCRGIELSWQLQNNDKK
jgi:hypothetical protein